ncbi:Os07g0508250 [Oryza sativa Japonica Group]|uniref:Os07g0508250 protein n=1 Tax=Oryza sativa subsp. japonica TaxID=39947 RepID=A0A0P0X6E4_ORYSJ|nr:hypothetical protein EE612_039482 [Oryza sativa]BAT01688.1 Os07g0508250 [Oryza sativa Japonica Group]
MAVPNQITDFSSANLDFQLAFGGLCLREDFVWRDIFTPLHVGSREPSCHPLAFSFGPTIRSNLTNNDIITNN